MSREFVNIRTVDLRLFLTMYDIMPKLVSGSCHGSLTAITAEEVAHTLATLILTDPSAEWITVTLNS